MNAKTNAVDDTVGTGPGTDERRGEATRPLTVMVSEDLLRRLKVIAVLKDASVSEIVAEHLETVVRRDLKKLLVKLEP